MRRGSFHEEDYTGGQKVYRLRWEAKQYALTPKEVLSGLFVRYLISRGKLSEYLPTNERTSVSSIGHEAPSPS